MCLNSLNMLNTKTVCQKYFSAEMTQFKYRSLHSQMVTVVLIYLYWREYPGIYLRQAISDGPFIQIYP